MFAQSPRREPGRDRRPDLPHAARARDRLGRRLLRRRPRLRLHARVRRRGVRARRAAPRPRATSSSTSCSRRPRAPARRRSIPATASSRRTPAFARAVEDAGLVWIGPPPAAIELMGSKTARAPGDAGGRRPDHPRARPSPSTRPRRSSRSASEIGYPLADQGGRRRRRQGHEGRRLGPTRPSAAFESAQREGQSYFADASVYVERYLEDPRHVEVQVLADAHGNVIHLGERDCTIQRRHQKLVEETPSPAVGAELRERIGQIAVDAARAVGYRSRRDDRGAARRRTAPTSSWR